LLTKSRLNSSEIGDYLAYKQEDALKSALDQCEAVSNKTLMSFETGWAIVQGRFNIMRHFCGLPLRSAEKFGAIT
jgi:hypothetical protein